LPLREYSVRTIVPTIPIDCARLTASENPINTIRGHEGTGRINSTDARDQSHGQILPLPVVLQPINREMKEV